MKSAGVERAFHEGSEFEFGESVSISQFGRTHFGAAEIVCARGAMQRSFPWLDRDELGGNRDEA